jgi:hypothetical protein
MALGRIGANRINDLNDDTETSQEAILCRLFYAQTRDALQRSNLWRFARARETLSPNTVSPDFEYSYAYDLPSDFLRMISIFEDNDDGANISRYTYSLEGKQLLSDEDSMEIRYIRQVTDPTVFDPLFVEVLVLQLALKLVMPLSQDKVLRRELYTELWGPPRNLSVMARVRALDKQETNTLGRADMDRWIDTFVAGSGNPLKRYS